MPPKRQYLSTKVRHHIAENCNLHTAIKNETSQKSIIFILKVFTGLKSIFYKFPKMPLVWTKHVQRQNGNTQIYIKIIPMEQAHSVCGVRLPGEKSWWKKIFLLPMALRHFLGHVLPCLRPPIAMSCRCTPFFFVLNNLAVSIRTSFHLFLSFPAGLLHPRHHSRIRFEILLSIVPITGPAHFYLSICMQKGSLGS